MVRVMRNIEHRNLDIKQTLLMMRMRHSYDCHVLLFIILSLALTYKFNELYTNSINTLDGINMIPAEKEPISK